MAHIVHNAMINDSQITNSMPNNHAANKPTKKKGVFISVEGIDGAGKSSHIEFIAEYFANVGYKVVTSREPGGTKLGERLRELLLSKDVINVEDSGMNKAHGDSFMQRITELLLMFASRQQLLSEVIAPSMREGACVLVDRFIDASIAYQGYGRLIGVKKINSLIALLEDTFVPDLTLIFNVDVDTAMQRVSKHNNCDRIESEKRDFFKRVQDGYLQIASDNKDRVRVIDTTYDKQSTRTQIAYYLEELLAKI